MKYPAEFKQKVLKAVQDGMPVKEAAKAFKVSRLSIYGWRQEHRAALKAHQAPIAFPKELLELRPPSQTNPKDLRKIADAISTLRSAGLL